MHGRERERERERDSLRRESDVREKMKKKLYIHKEIYIPQKNGKFYIFTRVVGERNTLIEKRRERERERERFSNKRLWWERKIS